MKKNKLLLSLGSLSIFSAIPFVAAKCDNTETKDNNSSSSKEYLELLILEQLKKKALKLT